VYITNKNKNISTRKLCYFSLSLFLITNQ